MSKEVFGALEWLLSTTKSLVSQKPVRNLDEVLSHCEKVVSTQAAANKAAEEGGLPFAELSINQKRALSEGLSALEAMADIWSAEIRLSEMAQRIADAPAEQRPGTIAAMIEQAFIEGAYRHFLDHKDAADRASRQVANKAEVDLSSLKRYYRSDTGMEHTRKSGGWVKFKDVRELLATPPATTGASTVLTDERISEIATLTCNDEDYGGFHFTNSGRYSVLSFARAIEREVAAQAGQVAVPEDWKLVPVQITSAMQLAGIDKYQFANRIGMPEFDVCDAIEMAWDAMLAAAPSPAKESK